MTVRQNAREPLVETMENRLMLSNGNAGATIIVARDAGAAPLVRVFDAATQTEKFSFLAYDSSFTGGVTVASGDFNRDGVPDVITGMAHDGGLVKVFSGADRSLLRSFFPYGALYKGGVYVAGGDVNGDGFDDIVTGAAGGGSQVKVFSGRDMTLLKSFIAFDPSFTGGVTVATGDLNGDGAADVVAATAGGAGLVKAFDARTGAVLASFEPYGPFAGGVFVRAADVDGDGRVDVITAPGSGSPLVRVFAGDSLKVIASFDAFGPSFVGGVRVAAGDLDGDGRAEIVLATGPGNQGQIALFSLNGGLSQTNLAPTNPFQFDGFFVGAGIGPSVPNPHGKEATPLKLTGSGQLNLDPATLMGAVTASGHSTHLGHWTAEGAVQFTQTGATTFGAEGAVTFTAANGDKLFATLAGALDLATGKASATFTFTGGTGRFSGAGGTAEAVILQDPSGAFTLTLDGELAPSKAKH